MKKIVAEAHRPPRNNRMYIRQESTSEGYPVTSIMHVPIQTHIHTHAQTHVHTHQIEKINK